MARMTCGEAAVGLLKAYGVDTVFGIPGVHTLELYRGLGTHGLRHVTVRHEQGAAFMADGYARVSGRPGVCMLISGPGVTNAATPLAAAYSDSSPVLAISSVQARDGMGMGRGDLHEVTVQSATTAPFTAFSATAFTPSHLPNLIARAFGVFAAQRPRPVHIEVPTDVLAETLDVDLAPRPLPEPPAPAADAVARAARLLAGAKRPVMLVGAGANGQAEGVTRLAERLGAAVLLTRASKGAVREDHPLCLGFSTRRAGSLALLAEADVVLAVATELAATDHMQARLPLDGARLVRIDLDPGALVRDYPAEVPLLGDAGRTVAALLAELGPAPNRPVGFHGSDKLDAVRKANEGARTPKQQIHIRALAALREALPPEAFIAADSTQLAYTGSIEFASLSARSWLYNVGFGTLGFALPAAIGAKLAAPDRPGIVIVGDGGMLFTATELATAAALRLPLPIVLWNNDSYAQIKDDMAAKGFPQIGVELENPDWLLLAKAFNCHGQRPDSRAGLVEAVQRALKADRPTLIEVRENAPFLAA